ncbi:MAG: hypothetical protein ABSG81_11940 [Acidimicrobiales bacterium]
MIVHGVAGLVELCLVGLLPALAVAGISSATLFLVPLASSAMAGIAATIEFGVGGSIGGCFVVVAVLANIAAALGLAVPFLAGVGWPLLVLQAPVIGFDAQAIWLVHTALVWGGHHTLVAGLTSNVYGFTNTDYPPLVPGTGALAYAVVGHVDQRLAVVATAVLSACAVAVLAAGITRVVPPRAGVVRRAGAVVVVIGFCGAVFGISGQFAVNGYTDTLWSAAALVAVVYGLVLPRTSRNLLVAWLCIVVASLTKNEGFVVSGAISVLVAVRCVPWAARRGRHGSGEGWARRLPGAARALGGAGWVRLVLTAGVPMVPGALWASFVKLNGIGSQLFISGRTESIPLRLSATAASMGRQLDLAPAALVVLLVGALTLRHRRRRVGAANPAWLWTVALAGLVVIGATYVFGTIEIHWWLSTSVTRTTIFDQMAFLVDMTIWALVAMTAPGRREPEPDDDAAQRHEPVPAARDAPRVEAGVG